MAGLFDLPKRMPRQGLFGPVYGGGNVYRVGGSPDDQLQNMIEGDTSAEGSFQPGEIEPMQITPNMGAMEGGGRVITGGMKSTGLPPTRTLYHGTRERGLTLTDDRPLYLTPTEAEAMGYARGGHLGGTGTGKPQVLPYRAAVGKTINVDNKLFEAMDEGDDRIDVLNTAIADAKANGYRFVEYTHPSFDASAPEQQVIISLFPKSDLR